MPPKYSHVKKRTASAPMRGTGSKKTTKTEPEPEPHHHHHHSPSHSPSVDTGVPRALSAISQLERAIAQFLLIRYEQDIARLFSTRLYSVSLIHLPTLVMRFASFAGPGWLVYNHDCEEIKDFFRAAISMDLRQAGERIATKSVLWSYTALRHFALTNNVSISQKRGLHSLCLLPFYSALKAHFEALQAMPPASFSMPPHLGSLQEGQEALEDACQLKYGRVNGKIVGGWSGGWRIKVRLGYEKLAQTLWRVAQEFDVRGYGLVLRERLTIKWCDCGCSTDHLGEVCEKTVREDEEESKVRVGKQREWDGRGGGVNGWETEEEEDLWEINLDFGGVDPDARAGGVQSDITIEELMEWRFFKAEQEKEEGNAAFRKGDYEAAIKFYETAHRIEPELPHYQLNLAAAYLKISNWVEAERACTKALGQHRSSKGYYRRARARRMLSRTDEAIRDLRSVIRIQPDNTEAIAELASLLPPDRSAPYRHHSQQQNPDFFSSPFSSQSQPSSSSEQYQNTEADAGGTRRPKHQKQPFAQTAADEMKLRIVPTTPPAPGVTSEDSGKDAQDLLYAHAHRRSWQASRVGDRERKKRGDKAKAGVDMTKVQELQEMLRSETVIYPSWDQYVIRREV